MSSALAQTSPETRVVLRTASGLSGIHPHGAMLPEALLLALLQEPAIQAQVGPLAAEQDSLRQAVLLSEEQRDADGWSERAKAAYQRAWKRAYDRGRRSSLLGARLKVSSGPWGVALRPSAALTLGDLLSGLSGSGRLVDQVLRLQGLNPGSFDDEKGADLPKVDSSEEHENLAMAAQVDVLAMNDPTTSMDFVVTALETHFDCSQVGALYLMYSIDERGSARVFSGPRDEAQRRVAAATDAAKDAGFPLAFVWGRRL